MQARRLKDAMATPPKPTNPPGRRPIDELRGATRLAVEATRGVTDLVEAMQQGITGGTPVVGRPLAAVTRMLNKPIFGSIRGVTELVGAGIDAALAPLSRLLAPTQAEASDELAALLAAVNGVLGDFLEQSGNPLAIPLRLRHGGRVLEPDREALARDVPTATGNVAVLVHGSCMNDRQWTRRGHDHGAALAKDLGFTPVYLHYNSGLHVSTNGRAFAEALERLLAAWPCAIERLVIVGHSMGGLVARSACLVAEAEGHAWRRQLESMICLGTPHHGAPLERGGNWIDLLLGATRYSAPLARLGKIRSAGVTDLRFGYVHDEHWEGRDRFAHGVDLRGAMTLPAGVRCFAIAATRAAAPGDRLPGDGLVPVDSALGRHPDPARALDFPEAHQWIGYGMDHLDLLDRADVYATIRGWLAPPEDLSQPPARDSISP